MGGPMIFQAKLPVPTQAHPIPRGACPELSEGLGMTRLLTAVVVKTGD